MLDDTGVAFFDTTDSGGLRGGWCSRNGAAARIFTSAAGDLSPQAFWVTNLDVQEHIHHQMGSTPNIRNAGYFRLPLKTIGNEIGLYAETPAPDSVTALSLVAARVSSIAAKCCPGMSPSGFTLSDAIYAWLRLDDERNDHGAQHQRPLQAAFQENSSVTQRRARVGESEAMRLIPSRVGYTEKILSYPTPTGPARVIAGAMPVDRFVDLDHPAIAEVSTDFSRTLQPELIAFGAQFSGTGIMRNWVTQPEMYFMAQRGATFRIHNVVAFESSSPAPQLPDAITRNPLIRSSYSAGLFADNYLYALVSKRRVRSKAGARFFFPSRAVHLRAIDRLMSFIMAEQIAHAGFRVTGYGFGTISVVVTQPEVPDLIDAAAGFGFAQISSSLNRFGRDEQMPPDVI